MRKRKSSLIRMVEAATPTAVILAVLLAWELFVRCVRDCANLSPAAEHDRCLSVSHDRKRFDRVQSRRDIASHLRGLCDCRVAGVTLGVLMGMSRLIARIVDPWIAALYPLPKIALIPLLVIWLGTGEVYKIVISAVTAFFPIVISTYAGIRQTDRGLIKAAEDLGASRRQIQLKVVIPAAIPSIFAGLHLGMGSYCYSYRSGRNDRQLEPERDGLFAHPVRAGDGNGKSLCESRCACDRRRPDHKAAAMDRPESGAVDGLYRDGQ